MTYIMSGFNLDIDAYKDSELENLMNLTIPYLHEDVSNAKEVLLRQLTNDAELTPERKREIALFVDSVASRIANSAPQRYKFKHQKPHLKPHVEGTWAENKVPIEQYGSNVIIKNPNEIIGKHANITEGRISMSGKVPPGYINPINVRTTSRAINIDSRFRPNYYKTSSTQFSMNLPAIEKRVVRITVGALEIPLTYHAISQKLGNNKCLIIDNAGTGSEFEAWLLTLPDGIYGTNELKGSPGSAPSIAMDIEIAMNNAIATADPGHVNMNTGVFVPDPTIKKLKPDINVCYRWDRISGRSVFATPTGSLPTAVTGGMPGAGGSSRGFTVRFNIGTGDDVPAGSLAMDINIQFRLGWQLGFRAAEYIGGGIPSLGGAAAKAAAVSEGICFISGPRYGFLAINDYQKNRGKSYMVAFTNSSLDENIMMRLNLAAAQNGVGVYKSANDPGLTTMMNTSRDYFGPVDIQKLTITLYDEYGRVIDLNNMDWSFTLTLERLYD